MYVSTTLETNFSVDLFITSDVRVVRAARFTVSRPRRGFV
jgi:hypothetical protein